MPLKNELEGFLKPNRTFFGIPEPSKGDPDVGVLGIPYDLTSSYLPGCRFGPDTIRKATDSERSHSYPLSLGRSMPGDALPLSKKLTLEDIGDLEVSGRLPDAAMHDISEATAKLTNRDSYILFLGGDHFITFPILKGLTRNQSKKLGLVYLDAHADYYEDYGGYKLSHATTLRRIIEPGFIDIDKAIVGDIRSALPKQREELSKAGAHVVRSANDFGREIGLVAGTIDTFYISIDLDILSPNLVPGVSHPESGGLSVVELLQILQSCFQTGKVRYVDIVELNPMLDKTKATSVVTRDILKEVLTGFATQKSFK